MELVLAIRFWSEPLLPTTVLDPEKVHENDKPQCVWDLHSASTPTTHGHVKFNTQ